MITSRRNPRIQAATRLRLGRERQKQGRIIIDGAREVLRAWNAGIELSEVFVCEELCSSDDCRKVLDVLAESATFEKAAAHGAHPQAQSPGRAPGTNEMRARAQSLGLRGPVASNETAFELLRVSRDVFGKLAFGERADGVVAVARMPARSLTDLTLPPNALVAVLEGVEKPGNVGAVLRSADAAGVSALIVADGGTDVYNPNAIRASMGTIFSMPICAASAAETLEWLNDQGLAIYAAWVDAECDYADANFTRPCAIVLGSEAQGLSGHWQSAASSAAGNPRFITPIKLPMLGVADSLNISAAAAVLFYEALRQRRVGKTG